MPGAMASLHYWLPAKSLSTGGSKRTSWTGTNQTRFSVSAPKYITVRPEGSIFISPTNSSTKQQMKIDTIKIQHKKKEKKKANGGLCFSVLIRFIMWSICFSIKGRDGRIDFSKLWFLKTSWKVADATSKESHNSSMSSEPPFKFSYSAVMFNQTLFRGV